MTRPEAPPRPRLELPSPPRLAPPEGFAARLEAVGARIDAAAFEVLGDYLARLLAMNDQLNLTSIVDPTEAWERHILDALTLMPLIADLPPGAQVVDVGSGGGVPGIPIAIAAPHLEVTLIESTQKKAAFLRDVCDAIGLTRVRVLADRSEQVASGPLGGTFDAVTARAVARTEALVALTAPLAKRGGILLLIKGQRADEELAAAARAMKRYGVVHRTTLATPTGRVIVLERSAGAGR